MIDVDGFKLFNDQFGPVAGDRVLSSVAQSLQQQFRPRDLLVRFGGDEFAVLLPGVNETEALAIADRVRRTVSGSTDSIDKSLTKLPVHVSMGVAQLDSHGTIETLVGAANKALHRAKDAGRNTVSN